MKVLHILNELSPSGAEVMLYSAGPLLKDYSITGEILSTGQQKGRYAEHLANAGYTIHHIPFSKSPAFFLALYSLLKTNAYDVVHLHTERANFWLGLVALITTKRCIRTIHSNFPFTGFLGWKRKWQRRLLNRLGLSHIAISPSVHDTEYKFYQLPTQIIPNWYNSLHFTKTTETQYTCARQQLNIPENHFVLVSIGNCSSVKNHPALIEALAKLNQPNIVYLHVGIEKDNSEQELAEKLGIKDLIMFKGMQSDVLPYLQAADLFVMCSTYEGFSIAALEAIATGLPALLTQVNGLSDLTSFFDGLHYCQPTAESLSEALGIITKNSVSDLKAKALKNSEKAEQLFGIKQGLTSYVNTYRNLF
ncbi:MAG: glycosyltransferase [Methylococcales bacterium]|nr:glycosyltransferase [Methylococcales bacterium]